MIARIIRFSIANRVFVLLAALVLGSLGNLGCKKYSG
jgi:Cu/Ag efflux pump CusA